MQRIIFFVLALVAFLWFTTPWILPYWSSFFMTEELKSLSGFSEQFAPINALFSGLALIFAVIAIMMQTKEMKLLVKENFRLSNSAEIQIQNQKLLAALQALISARNAKIQDVSLHKTLYTKAIIYRTELILSNSKENSTYTETLKEIDELIDEEKNKNIEGFKHLETIDQQISKLLQKLDIDEYNVHCHE